MVTSLTRIVRTYGLELQLQLNMLLEATLMYH